jgi:bifunctional non-homologous end joining protein LigD
LPVLEKYGEKRDFQETPEPPPSPAGSGEGPLIFVVQKHAAARLHYDFRLEVDGVLKSWPVPKGPSLDPAQKRLAVMVEDHPLDYAWFEGVIPRGQYGAGQVIVWDAGTYSPDEGGRFSFHDRDEANARMREGLQRGKLSVFLRGHKLKGSWTLVKSARGENEWLLIKHSDRFADRDRDVLQEDRSVLSGLTIEDLKAGRLPERGPGLLPVKPGLLPGARKAVFPRSIEPMMAALSEKPFSSPDWYFEPKLDGVRAVAFINGGAVRLQSRRGLDVTRQYPSIARELQLQTERQMVLDGEIVALDESGAPSFQRLQQRLNLTGEADIRRAEAQIAVCYYVFDLLHAGGYELRNVPLHYRKSLLKQILIPSDRVLLVEHFEKEGEAAYRAAVEHGLEGVIAKRRDSLYECGRRSRWWLKVKSTLEDEFVVGGYRPGAGGRAGTFGALLLGQYDRTGRLLYVGSVGSGFDDRTLYDLKARLEALRTDECPFAATPRGSPFARRRWPEGAPVWVRPELVARVKFAHRTENGMLRSPVFLDLREDKRPEEAVLEKVTPPPPEVILAAGPTLDDVESVIDQLSRTSERFTLRVEGHRLPVTNLNKPLWPPLGERPALTKRDLLLYLSRVSPYLLPHMRDRPITLTRYPHGITGEHFYQKHWDAPLPEFVETVRLFSEHNEGDREYLMCNNLATLLWLGQLADIELHTWYSRVSPEPDGHHLPTVFTGSAENIDASLLNYPDFIVFDLDPSIYSGKETPGAEPELNRKAFSATCEVAMWLKEILDSLSLSSFVKTTGRTGLHIYVPILRRLDYDSVRAAAETIGRFLVRAHPRRVTLEWSVSKRAGKVFFDYNQNARGKTLASVYSPRPTPEASVSMPVRWDELPAVYPTQFTILTAPDRLQEVGDLWANILDHKHDLAGTLET